MGSHEEPCWNLDQHVLYHVQHGSEARLHFIGKGRPVGTARATGITKQPEAPGNSVTATFGQAGITEIPEIVTIEKTEITGKPRVSEMSGKTGILNIPVL